MGVSVSSEVIRTRGMRRRGVPDGAAGADGLHTNEFGELSISQARLERRSMSSVAGSKHVHRGEEASTCTCES